MKEKYVSPEVEIIIFSSEDIITTSGTRGMQIYDMADGEDGEEFGVLFPGKK